MATLLIAEHDNASVKDSTNKALTAATALGGEVDVLVAGENAKAAADAAARLAGVRKVLLADNAAYAHDLAEPLAALIVALAPGYDAFVAPATSRFKNVMPRVAALLDVMQISEITKVIAPDTFERPIYAGNAIQTVRSRDAKKVITIRTAAFQAAGEGGPAPIEPTTAATDPGLSAFVGEELSKTDRPELTAAKIVISGGRAMQSRENFAKYIEPVADKLGATGSMYLAKFSRLCIARPPEMTILAAVSSGRSVFDSSSPTNADRPGSVAAVVGSIGAGPPSPAAWKAAVLIVITFLASRERTVWMALPA